MVEHYFAAVSAVAGAAALCFLTCFLAFMVFAGAFVAAAGAFSAGAGALSAANAVPRVRANAIAVKRATIFFIGIHLLSLLSDA
jgi:hypothetical protein